MVILTRTPYTGVVHVRHSDQESLCRQFVRLQEFYESPHEEIRGKFFTLDKFKEVYSRDSGGNFTYYTDWHGFNVPGHIVREFFSLFAGHLSYDEKWLQERVFGLDNFYLIGSHEGSDKEDALDHELVHATWYLDDEYREKALALVMTFLETHTGQKLARTLRSWGYGDNTLFDEINAYMSTTGRQWWIEETKGDEAFARDLWDYGYSFRTLAAAYKTDRWLPR